jgi:lipopolysaccharide/colanic/teichoic acid biosynthesis glycosyltransferase
MEATNVPIRTDRPMPDAEPIPAREATALESPRLLPGPRPAVAGSVRPLRHRWYPPCKAVLDFLLAVLLAVPALPVVLLAAAAVKLTSRGSAFYTQIRVGRDGRPFVIYKLRTMLQNCESLTGPRWSVPGDPRVTPVGGFLRASHLDELPQLLNVLRGEMSLVGPRPERPEFLPELEAELPAYPLRLALRPGVTGLAQVQLPPDTSLGSVRQKLAHDLYYVRHLSPWLDLRLLLCTVLYVLGVPFGVAGRLLAVPGRDAVEDDLRRVLGEGPAPAQRSA